MKTIFYTKSLCRTTIAVVASSLCLLAGCSNDRTEDGDAAGGSFALMFDACVGDVGALTTRARDNSSVTNITNQFYGENDFYISVGSKEDGIETVQSSVYEIPSATSGTLLPKEGQRSLTWRSRTAEHEFWAWSARRDMKLEPTVDGREGEYRIQFKGSTLNETVLTAATGAVAAPWKTTDDDENAGEYWRNGEVLEKLIGAKTGSGSEPLVYNDNGMYVTLQFRHLVSKIFLKNMTLIDNMAGTTSSTYRGLITFYGMPDEATLCTSPTDKDGNRIAPYVAKPDGWTYNQSKSVTYALTNNSMAYTWEGYYDSDGNLVTSSKPDTSNNNMRDCWYVCPELDLSKLSFKIELYEYNSTDKTWSINSAHGKHGAFYGDFRDVKFSRTTTGKDYDDPNNTNDTKYDDTVLHAGEYLILSISLSEKGNPTATGTIVSSWYTGSRTGNSHVQQGLYSVGDVTQMSTIMSGSDEAAKQQYYEMMGSGRDTSSDDKEVYPDYKDKDGNPVDLKIFELFDDIGSDSYSSGTTSNKVSSLVPGDGYMLDGRGHTVNFSGSTGIVTIGNVRDVYLKWYNYTSSSSTYTECIVYIDKEGNVWLVDPVTFVHTPTEYNVNDTPGSKTINLSTGEIK